MNRSRVTPPGHWSLFVLAARYPQDWKIPRCPLVLMFDLVRSVTKLFLIGSAGAVLGVAGFILVCLFKASSPPVSYNTAMHVAEHPCIHQADCG